MSEFDAPIASSEDLADFVEASSGECCGTRSCDEELTDCSFADVLSGSLEDLVNTFDQKIVRCFRDYEADVKEVAPVPMQTQEEMLGQCPAWLALASNCGKVTPVCWSTSRARALQLAVLDLPADASLLPSASACYPLNGLQEEDEEEEELARDLDLHSLILHSLHREPVASAEDVLREIDELMRDQLTSGLGSSISTTAESSPSLDCSLPHLMSGDVLSSSGLLWEEGKKRASVNRLSEVMVELERLIQSQSEVLISELAFRDELEFEKELKNSFIALVLAIQHKTQQLTTDKKKKAPTAVALLPRPSSVNSFKYVTTVIPYDAAVVPPDVRTMQVLIKSE